MGVCPGRGTPMRAQRQRLARGGVSALRPGRWRERGGVVLQGTYCVPTVRRGVTGSSEAGFFVPIVQMRKQRLGEGNSWLRVPSQPGFDPRLLDAKAGALPTSGHAQPRRRYEYFIVEKKGKKKSAIVPPP